jgi:hypothetical protein
MAQILHHWAGQQNGLSGPLIPLLTLLFYKARPIFFKVEQIGWVIELFYDFPICCMRMFIQKGIHPCYSLPKKKAKAWWNTRLSSLSLRSS